MLAFLVASLAFAVPLVQQTQTIRSQIFVLDQCGGEQYSNGCTYTPNGWDICNKLGGFQFGSGRFCAAWSEHPIQFLDQCHGQLPCDYKKEWDVCTQRKGNPWGEGKFCVVVNKEEILKPESSKTIFLDQCGGNEDSCTRSDPWSVCEHFNGILQSNHRYCALTTDRDIRVLDQCGYPGAKDCTMKAPWMECKEQGGVPSGNNEQFCFVQDTLRKQDVPSDNGDQIHVNKNLAIGLSVGCSLLFLLVLGACCYYRKLSNKTNEEAYAILSY